MLLLYEIGLLASWLTHREEGNYFTDLPMVERVRLLLAWVVRQPVVMVHKIHGKFRDNNKF